MHVMESTHPRLQTHLDQVATIFLWNSNQGREVWLVISSCWRAGRFVIIRETYSSSFGSGAWRTYMLFLSLQSIVANSTYNRWLWASFSVESLGIIESCGLHLSVMMLFVTLTPILYISSFLKVMPSKPSKYKNKIHKQTKVQSHIIIIIQWCQNCRISCLLTAICDLFYSEGVAAIHAASFVVSR